MRKLWTNNIDRLWKRYQQLRCQTDWKFHLKTNNLAVTHDSAFLIDNRPSVSIRSMHFVFPFCPLDVGYIVIPISKQTWKTEGERLPDFSSFLPLIVQSYRSTIWNFFYLKFTVRNLIEWPKSSLLDRGLDEFIFPNATFAKHTDKIFHCCELNPIYNSSLGRFEKLGENWEDKDLMSIMYNFPILSTEEYVLEILLTTDKDYYTFLSCGESYNDAPDFLALFMPFSKTTWALIFITIFG